MKVSEKDSKRAGESGSSTRSRERGLSLISGPQNGDTMRKTLAVALLELALMLLLPEYASAQAEDIYRAQCSSCHGIDGSASTPAGKRLGATDLRSEKVQHLSDDELFATIANGVGHKQYPHAFASRGVTQKQITEIVAYIRTMSKNYHRK